MIARSYKNATGQELDRIALMMVEAFNDDSTTQAATGNDKSKMFAFHRSFIAAGAVGDGLELMAVTEPSAGDVMGAAVFVGPGKEILADEQQLAQGFTDFLQTIPAGSVAWLTETFFPQYRKVVDGILGVGVKQQGWSVNSFAVAKNARGKGVARALSDAGETLAKRDGVPLVVETEKEESLNMYLHLGYELVGAGTIAGGSGISSFEVKVLRKTFQQ